MVMNHEDAHIAGTNRLPPLIVYDVAPPPPPTSFLDAPSLSLPPSLTQGMYDLSEAVSRSWPRRAAESFTAPDVSDAPLTRPPLTGPDRPALT